MTIVEMRQKRAALYEQAIGILNTAEAEHRQLTAEERQQYDRLMNEMDTLKGDIDRMERAEDVAKEFAAKEDKAEAKPEQRNTPITATPEYREAFVSWLRAGMDSVSPELRKVLSYGRANVEGRAQSAIVGAAGGFTVPQQFLGLIVDAMKSYSGMRQVATILSTTVGNPIPIPTANDSAVEGEIVAENITATSGDIAFGQVILNAYKYSSKSVLVPFELLQDTGIDLEAYIAAKLGERIGRITNRHYTSGDGVNKPRGILLDAVEGKVGAAGQVDSITYDDLVDLEFAVDAAYRANAKYMLHDQTLKAVKKLKDSQGRPLWQPGIAVREPDTINGYPYVVNNHMDPMGAGSKSVLFGDFSNYYIRDVADVVLFRITDKYVESGQVGFLAWFRSDGRLIDAGSHPVAYYQNPNA